MDQYIHGFICIWINIYKFENYVLSNVLIFIQRSFFMSGIHIRNKFSFNYSIELIYIKFHG